MVEYRLIKPGIAYRVGDDGSVWTCLQRAKTGKNRWEETSVWRRMSPNKHVKGYRAIALTRINGRKPRRVHHLVLEAFVGPCPEGMEGCHKNGNPADNRLENLRWDTHHGNMKDAIDQGRIRSPMTKLTEDDVRNIRRRLATGERQKPIAIDYGVCVSTVGEIKCGRLWKHVG
jgi:hypothetical protein